MLPLLNMINHYFWLSLLDAQLLTVKWFNPPRPNLFLMKKNFFR
jgi:hypothetical protein